MENDKLDTLLNEGKKKLNLLKIELIIQILDTIIFMLTACFVVSGNITLFYIGVFILILQVIVSTSCIVKRYKIYKNYKSSLKFTDGVNDCINKSKQSV